MVDNDIYDNKRKWVKFISASNLNDLTFSPKAKKSRKRKYYVKYAANIKYFKDLEKKFKARDTSYIRRLRLCRVFLVVMNFINKDLKKVTRDDIDKIMAISHDINKSVDSKRCFALDLKFIWKQLFPELDDKGRKDETIFPYAVRHLTGKVDKSKEKLKRDKFSLEEFEKLLKSFGSDARMQALLSITLESLSRPQELLGRKIEDVEIHDNYAKIYISQHGKEGVGFLRIIDSYPYLIKWFNQHPLKDDPNAYLFINTGTTNRDGQLKPVSANKMIRERCKRLKINKPITLYSLKRNGVTMMRLQGKSDLEIQHTARWTSTKQLKTYDMSGQEESFKLELVKRGLIEADEKTKSLAPKSKICIFCSNINGLTDSVCSKCKRPLDRKAIESDAKKKDKEIENLRKEQQEMKNTIRMIAKAMIKDKKRK